MIKYNGLKAIKYSINKVFKSPYSPALCTHASPGSPVKSSTPG